MSSPEVFTATEIYRPGFGKALAVGIAVLGLAGLVSGFVSDAGETVRFVAPVTLVVAAIWLAFWYPAVIVSPAGVELRNVTRTIELPWPAIQRIDTKYALTLYTAWGSYSAWAAPAPGRSQVERGAREARSMKLPSSTFGPDGVRPGDLPSSASGAAALLVRRRWEAMRDAGLLEDPRLERERPRVRWHWAALVALVVLALASVVSLAL